MTKTKITIGGNFEEEASKGVIEAWHRAERGEVFCERHHAFENWKTFFRFLLKKLIHSEASNVQALTLV